MQGCQTNNGSKIQETKAKLKPIAFSDIHVRGEMLKRALKNYDRLEDDIYRPENVFFAGDASKGWPGDKEGRIILGLTLQAQATHRTPKYLDEIIDLIPKHLNVEGYLGPVLKDSVMEQQLSGHGWLLRGLCEYYAWKKDSKVKMYIQDIIQNLALPTKGMHKHYPIDSAVRKQDIGRAAGTTQNTIDGWKLSSDIGCDFIFLDGIVQAYNLFPTPELKELIDEMVQRFFEMDLVAIKAQTHATLTGLRGVLRYYELTSDSGILKQVIDKYDLYRTLAMTANFENYNWFGRPKWTEPCAIIDSYMVAVQLWKYTRAPMYLEDAQHIYYNAISHTQRANGGFGLDNCPRPNSAFLKVLTDEAYWCCTMRGGEGMAAAIHYNYFKEGDSLFVPFFNSSEADFTFDNKNIKLKQTTDYPFKNKAIFEIVKSESINEITLNLFAPTWTENHQLLMNGKLIKFTKNKGFISSKIKLVKGNHIEFSFDMKSGVHPVINGELTSDKWSSLYYGPLVLGYEGKNEIVFDKVPQFIRKENNIWIIKNRNVEITPVYHLMIDKIGKETGYQKQVLFRTKG